MRRKILALMAAFLFLSPLAAEPVQYETPDGVKLVGEYFKPTNKKWTLLLHHGLGSVKEEWTPFAQFLVSQGYGVFIYDARGHGMSTHRTNGNTVDFHYFYGRGLESDWGKMIGDVQTSVEFLHKHFSVDPKTVATGGASIGANIVFRHAAAHPEVPFTILFSPGLDYQGITTNDLFPVYFKSNRKLAAMVSRRDRYSYKSCLTLKKVADYAGAGPRLRFFTAPFGHGAQMLLHAKDAESSPMERELVKWMDGMEK